LQKEKLENWCKQYAIPEKEDNAKTVGLIMAGNIPLVGFHDFLCVFISGHKQIIKPSSKDETLIKHIVQYLSEKNDAVKDVVSFSEMLKGCDAYIATGSNNSARYFEYYFGKYPNIIRRNRTSVAVLIGDENKEELERLSSDISLYFGLGCRNVTKIYVPENYDFLPLLDALKKFDYFSHHPKYKNNYDYQLAILIINGKYYMTNGSIILTENNAAFSPISVLHYEYYRLTPTPLLAERGFENSEDIQCIAGKNFLPFGSTQKPSLTDYADGIDTLKFLAEL
ncbi:MAG TPA: acyl-CoA reductase, partial [Puia sp.]|nr:acyl-CoA reductase [Puia sp.]